MDRAFTPGNAQIISQTFVMTPITKEKAEIKNKKKNLTPVREACKNKYHFVKKMKS
jgi:hypothetical protein